MYEKLSKKTVIVTGSSRGIGKAIALAFGREGADVIVNYRKSEEEAREVVSTISDDMSGEAESIQADVSNANEVERMIKKTIELYGGVDILVNNAGVLLRKDLVETSEREWDRVMEVNLKGTFLCSKFVLPEMIDSGGGSIINIASSIGINAAPKRAAYCTSKGGIVLLTKQMAIDYGKDNIRVNCICPGVIDTKMNRERFNQSDDPERAIKKSEEKSVFGRLGKPEEVASATLFLASDEASFMTGTSIVVDGGWMLGDKSWN